MIIDGDQHIHEPRDCWRARIDPAHRDDALSIDDDELGYAWLTWRGERLYLAEVQHPGKAKAIGDERLRIERGEPAERSYDEQLAPEYTDARARVAKLDEWGLDAAVCLPNFGLLWESLLASDPVARRANLRAYNRCIAEVQGDGGGRLHGVAHLVLDDPDWVRDELASLARADVRLAMVGPTTWRGRALGHQDHDDVWRAFVDAGISPVFHVGGFRPPLDEALFADDPEPVDKLMNSVMLWVPPAATLAHMAIHGAFERHPDLRVGVIELTAHWVPQFLLMLDGSWGFYAARHGRPLADLPMRPSEYIRRQVRVGALAYEQPANLIDLVGEDVFMFGSDWPHAEGIADPLGTYEKAIPDLEGSARDKLLGGNAAWLMRR